MNGVELRYGYLTKEDFKTAERNGIRRRTASSRVYEYGWDIDRAITQPVKRNPSSLLWDEWKPIAEKNGITAERFRVRMKIHLWTAEKAATLPLQVSNSFDRWTQEEKDTIKANGLSINLANTRVYTLGWDKETAINHPKMTPEERGAKIKAGIAKKKEEGVYIANKGILI